MIEFRMETEVSWIWNEIWYEIDASPELFTLSFRCNVYMVLGYAMLSPNPSHQLSLSRPSPDLRLYVSNRNKRFQRPMLFFTHIHTRTNREEALTLWGMKSSLLPLKQLRFDFDLLEGTLLLASWLQILSVSLSTIYLYDIYNTLPTAFILLYTQLLWSYHMYIMHVHIYKLSVRGIRIHFYF